MKNIKKILFTKSCVSLSVYGFNVKMSFNSSLLKWALEKAESTTERERPIYFI